MRKSVKTRLILASVLVVFGLAVFTGVMFAYDWDFSKLNTVAYVTNTYQVNENFNGISINTNTTDVTFAPSDDATCRIVCHEMENVKHTAKVQNGILTIQTVDTRKWYEHISISFHSLKMTVYLPHDAYDTLCIETDTGDILIPKDFSFNTLEIEGDTADVTCFAAVSGETEIASDTGNIHVEDTKAGNLHFSTATGNVTLKAVTVNNNVEIEVNTGDIRLEKVIASGDFSIESDTGDVRFDGSDAQRIFVQTNTGDVKGTLLSDKVFITETDTGRINVPQTASGGRCEIVTNTGDVILAIEN